MKAERWQQIDQVLQAALGCAPEQRKAFLDEACEGDEALRREVESLLVAHQEAGGFMEEHVSQVAAELMAEDEVEAAAGRVISHYRIIKELGRGGMGEVYLAYDTRLGRKVAIKLLPEFFTRDKGRVRRFEQEARAASALNHPNILTIYELGQEDSIYFIATEYIEGKTLRQHMAQGEMRLTEVLDIAMQVASALSAAHQAAVVHRDIKPENIMIRPDGYVKVLDFGLAKLTERPATDLEANTRALIKTDAGMVMGTAQYISPEQARGFSVDARTDIWSLGVVLYEMITGRPPFDGPTMGDVISLILLKEAPPLSQYLPEAPAELQRIVKKVLRKDRDERYQTAKDVALDLKNLQRQFESEKEFKQPVRLAYNSRAVTRRAAPQGEINLGPFVPKMCDRSPQVSAFTDFFFASLKHHPGVPQIYFVHGEERECHDSLIERLIHTQIKHIAEKEWGEQRSVVAFKKARWAYEGDLAELQRELKRTIFMEFDPTYMGEDLSATSLSKLASSLLSPLIVIRHNIYAEHWNKLTGELIAWYFTYWADIKRPASGPQFLIFLNIIYPKIQATSRWKAWLASRRFDKKRVRMELQELSSSRNAGCLSLVLKELSPPKQFEVGDWFSHYNIYDEKLQGEILKKIFKPDDKQIGMADIEHELQKIHQEFIKERQYSW